MLLFECPRSNDTPSGADKLNTDASDLFFFSGNLQSKIKIQYLNIQCIFNVDYEDSLTALFEIKNIE